jgi:hypothetical protein
MHPDLTCQELESTSDRLSAEMCGFCLSIVEGCAVIFVCSTFSIWLSRSSFRTRICRSAPTHRLPGADLTLNSNKTPIALGQV